MKLCFIYSKYIIYLTNVCTITYEQINDIDYMFFFFLICAYNLYVGNLVKTRKMYVHTKKINGIFSIHFNYNNSCLHAKPNSSTL